MGRISVGIMNLVAKINQETYHKHKIDRIKPIMRLSANFTDRFFDLCGFDLDLRTYKSVERRGSYTIYSIFS